MDDMGTLIRGIGRIALAMRERADKLGFANASHLHAIADSLDAEVETACPQRRKWRDAPTTGRAVLAAEGPTRGEVLAGTYRGMPVYVNGQPDAPPVTGIGDAGMLANVRKEALGAMAENLRQSRAELIGPMAIPTDLLGASRDHLEPIRAVFRQCGMFDAAANDRLCSELHVAVWKQAHPLQSGTGALPPDGDRL